MSFDLDLYQTRFFFYDSGLTHNLSTENSDITYGSYGDLVDNSSYSLGAPHIEESANVNASLSLRSAVYTAFSDNGFLGINCPVSGNPDPTEFYDQSSVGPVSTYFGPSIQCSTEKFGNQYVENNVEMVANVNDDSEMLQGHDICSEDTVKFESPLGITGGTFSTASGILNSGISSMKDNIGGPDYILPNYRISFDNTDFSQTVGKTYPAQFLPQMMSNSNRNEQAICVKDENSNYMTENGAADRNFPGGEDQMSSKKQTFHINDEEIDELYATQGSANSTSLDLDDVEVADGSYTDKGLRQSLTGNLASTMRKRQVIAMDEIRDVYFASSKDNQSLGRDVSCMILSPPADGTCPDSFKRPFPKQSKHLVSPKEEMDTKRAHSHTRGSYSLKGSHQTVHRDSWVQKSQVIIDDSDICILEDLSEPVRQQQPPMNVKLSIPSRNSPIVESHNHIDVGGMRHKTKDERLIFRAAVQVSSGIFCANIALFTVGEW